MRRTKAQFNSAFNIGQSDSVGTIYHRFGFAVRRGDGAGIEVIATDDDRRLSARPWQPFR